MGSSEGTRIPQASALPTKKAKRRQYTALYAVLTYTRGCLASAATMETYSGPTQVKAADHSAARKNLANAKLGLQLDDASRLTLVANRVDLKAQDPLGLTYQQFQDDPRSAPLAEQYNTRKTVKQTQGGLVFDHQVDGRNALRVMVYYGQRDTTQYQSIPPAVQIPPTQAGGVIDLKREYGGADVRWTSELALGGRALTLIGGFAYDAMQEDRKGYQNFTGASPSRQLGVQGAHRDDHRQGGAVGAGHEGPGPRAHRVRVDLGDDQRNVRVHPEGGGVVDDDGAPGRSDRRPVGGHLVGDVEHGDVDALEGVLGDGEDLDLLTPHGQLAAGRAG